MNQVRSEEEGKESETGWKERQPNKTKTYLDELKAGKEPLISPIHRI